MNLRALQSDHKKWLAHNFPNQQPHEPLLGIVEEVGELSHAHLKYKQGIRGLTKSEYQRQAMDAIGDLVIYLASYCNSNDLNLEYCVFATWDKVKHRDWVADPQRGGEDERAAAGSSVRADT